MLIVGSVLLVACANIANMLLARSTARQREMGVRLALGASRSRIIRQLLTESILLSLLGGVGGLLVSLWTTKLLWLSIEQIFAGLFAGTVVFKLNLSPDVRVTAYALILSLLTGVLFGLSPALQFSRPDLTTALKEEGSSFGQRWNQSRVRSFLVAAQVAVSMVLLITTGLLLRGLLRSHGADPGFETRGVFLLFGDFGNDSAKAVALERRLIDRLQTLPGVKNVAHGDSPMMGTWTPPMIANNPSTSQGNSSSRTLASYASDTYFSTLGIALLRGRGFTRKEALDGARVAVISDATARRFWPGENPVGKRFKLDLHFSGIFTEFEVVGITKDVRFANLSRVDPAHVYLPTSVNDFQNVLFRIQGDPQSVIASVRTAVEGVNKDLLASLLLMNLEQGPLKVQKSLAQTCALYAAILAFLAVTLAGVGIYGIMAYLVSQRVKEIGLRMALGATAMGVLKAIVVQGLRPAFVGIIVGMSGAAGLSWMLHRTLVFPGSTDLFYGVLFYDPATFLGLSCFILLIAVIAALVPARRAVQVDPMAALRVN
jgi:putative ABC transport system permease protein